MAASSISSRRPDGEVLYMDVTLRRSEELLALEERVRQLEALVQRRDQEIVVMGGYASTCLVLRDQLHAAAKIMRKAGLDTSWIDFRR